MEIGLLAPRSKTVDVVAHSALAVDLIAPHSVAADIADSRVAQVDLLASASRSFDVRSEGVGSDIAAPQLLVVPTLDGGSGFLTVTGGVASEPCVRKFRAVKGATTVYSSWSTSFTTSVEGTMAALDGGTWTVSVELKDAAANLSRWFLIGNVVVLPGVE